MTQTQQAKAGKSFAVGMLCLLLANAMIMLPLQGVGSLGLLRRRRA